MLVDWEYIDAKYPSKLNKSAMTEAEYVKSRTIELYDYLPQTTLEERFEYKDIRDAVVDLNYKFFGYVASHTFINNSSIDYEDKFQSALFHFCEMWHKYRFAAKYRTDLSFGVFFKPRVGECIERELNEVKYSLRRALCMEVGSQLGKHWGQVTYEDLAHVDLAPDKMASLQAMFGSMYVADLDTHALYIKAEDISIDEMKFYSDDYDSLVDLLIHEMVTEECDLDDAYLLKLATLLDIPFQKLKDLMPEAKEKLYQEIQFKISTREAFDD